MVEQNKGEKEACKREGFRSKSPTLTRARTHTYLPHGVEFVAIADDSGLAKFGCPIDHDGAFADSLGGNQECCHVIQKTKPSVLRCGIFL